MTITASTKTSAVTGDGKTTSRDALSPPGLRHGDAADRTAANAQTHSATLHLQPTSSVRLSLAVKRLLIEQFEGPTLRILADLMDDEDPKLLARRRLTDEGVEKLADILIAGKRPTIGLFRKYRRQDVAP